ncbi:hypothetical protein [Streptomyces sp. KLOTTS4A1]|uniref:hypothetical protein n=1 Tax=Streptomyces sp. KLOTTS4A1 TaxID=3390996 RepID=UPI0039F49DE9
MTTWDFRPTHVIPQDGLPSWEEPDASHPSEPLDPLLPVRLVERRGDWARVECANGWATWVDARLLVSVPQQPPDAGRPLTRAADPRPLMARAEEALRQYRSAAEDLSRGQADGEAFHRRTQGLRVGMVVDGESVWLYDAEHERWVYCDGTRLTAFASAAPPSPNPALGGSGSAAPDGPDAAPGGPDAASGGPDAASGGPDAAPGNSDRPTGPGAWDVPGSSSGSGGTGGIGHEPTRIVDSARLREAGAPGDAPGTHGSPDTLNSPDTPDSPGAWGDDAESTRPPTGPEVRGET